MQWNRELQYTRCYQAFYASAFPSANEFTVPFFALVDHEHSLILLIISILEGLACLQKYELSYHVEALKYLITVYIYLVSFVFIESSLICPCRVAK
jgi:hypothetical protein